MKLASFRTSNGINSYGIVTDQGLIDLGARLGNLYPDLRAFIAGDAFAEAQKLAGNSPDHKLADITWLPVIPNPDKIVCVGLNYEDHRVEAGRDRTENPALFLRVPESQVGHNRPILRPRESDKLDYEAEIAIVIGKPGRRIAYDRAWEHVAGYAPYNDGSIRDWQRHTIQWIPGKNFKHTGGFGPWMVTSDEIKPGEVLELSARLNGQTMQHATTDMMIFSIPRQIEYISAFTTLLPGDVIVTGTPGGVGFKRNPPVFMKPGDVIEIEVSKVGVLSNTIADD